MIYIVIAIILLPLFWIVAVVNDFKKMNLKVKEAFANIDVALMKRYHVLTQLFEVAKGYAKHEKDVLMSVISVRQNMTLEEKEKADIEIENEYIRFFILSEGYPELKADTLFLNLQNAASEAEEFLAAARRLYNANVSIYNQKREMFPRSMIASNMNLEDHRFLSFRNEELENPNLSFD